MIAGILVPSILIVQAPPLAASVSSRPPSVTVKGIPVTRSGPDVPWVGGKGGLSTPVVKRMLSEFSLGVSLATALHTLGSPWVVIRQAARSYWMYRTDDGHAWFSLGVEHGRVDSIQVSLYAHDRSSIRGPDGVLLGGPSGQVTAIGKHQVTNAGDVAVEASAAAHGHIFYGFDRGGRIDRLGRSLGNDDLGSFARWYEFDGHGPDRPIPVAAYGGSLQGQRSYVARLNEPYIPCLGGNAWRVVTESRETFAGVAIDALKLRCGNTLLTRPYFFAATATLPRPFDVDGSAQRLIGSAFSAGVRTGGTTGQIWVTTPNGTRIAGTGVDFEFAYIDDPDNPLTSVTAVQVGESETVATSRAKGAARTATPPITIICTFGSGSGKCSQALGDGQPCFQLSATFGAFNVQSGTACFSVAGDPLDFSSFAALVGSLGCTGAPVNAVSGNLWYQYQDAQLSGPFGLSFSHRYDSTKSTRQGDLGLGWQETYGAYLDMTNASDGIVTFVDGSCNRIYLQTLGAGTSSYDQYSGDTLYTQSDGTFKLVTWDNRTFVFNTTGQLTSMSDRIGNTQTINRNTSGDITTVVDGLSRTLTFTYDTSNRITGITSTPSGVSITFTYTSILGHCYSGDLCSVKESDGSIWTYQYYNPSSYGGQHLLQYVIDPLGHTEEANTYQLINLGNGDNHYRVIEQSIDSGVNDNTYSYSISGTTGTTSISDALGHLTTYGWDQYLQQVTSVSGYLCFCRGDTLAYDYDIFGRPLSVTEGSDSTLATAQYGRDVQFTSPDGTTSYIGLAYPSVTQLQQRGILTDNGIANKNTEIAYYPLESAQQDLPQTVTEPSVDTAGAAAVTTYTFSSQGLPTAISRSGYSGGSAATHAVSATYDSRGRMLTFTGPRTDVTQTTTLGYYPDTDTDLARRGQLESIEDALGHTITFASAASPNNSYSIYGGPLSSIDPNGVVSDFAYDQRGRLDKTTLKGVTGDPTDLVTTLTYNAIGQLTSTSRPLGNALTNGYDAASRPTAITIVDASGNQREQFALAYNTASQLTTETAQLCATPASSCSTWQTKMSQTFGYASVGTLSSISDAAGGQTSLAWDKYGNNTGIASGSGAYQYTTTTGFDASHLVTSTQLSGSTVASYTHDLQSNLTRTTTPSTASSNTYFDDFGCLTKEISTYTGTTTQTCDRAGNVTSKTDANGATTTTTYDALNRPLVQTSTKSGASTETVTRVYDNTTSGAFGIGRLKSMTDPSGSTTYAYERRGLLATTTQTIAGNPSTTAYTYDGNGNETKLVITQGGVIRLNLAYTYDYADRPYSAVAGSTTYVSQATYEPMGPRASLTYGNATQQTITYDQGYRPTEAKVTHGSTTLSDLSYTFNSAGYVTQITDNLNAGYDQSLSYGGKATNMLTLASTGSSLWGRASYSDTVSQNLQTANFPGRNLTYGYSRTYQLQTINQAGVGVSNITHDAIGNEIGVGSSIYSYSARELLGAGDGITYTYDGLGRRVTAHNSSGTRAFLYDPNMHLQGESSLTSGALAYEYVWFGGTPVAQIDIGSATHWTATDERGAPFLQTDSSGNLYWQADYEPFGAIYDERTSDVHEPLRLPGQEAEQFTASTGPNGASGRYYNGFRWYRPQFGRYTQSDPIGYAPSGYSLYSYAYNNPFNYLDPYGLGCLRWQNGFSRFLPLLVGIGFAVALLVPGLDVAVLAGGVYEALGDLLALAAARLEAAGIITLAAALLVDESGAVEGPGADFSEGIGATFQGLFYSPSGLSFAQTTASPAFGQGGPFAGQSIEYVAAQLQEGTMSPSDLPITTVTTEGSQLIVNTRSVIALMQAGIPQAEWAFIDATDDENVVANIANRLLSNGLSSSGTNVVRIRGLAPNENALQFWRLIFGSD
ncbi:MAG TPA: RHS repeat-associated core domain-containing protein [Candidatus Binatia bacterium]|nr:RHS repeat-associated core domain-containing protein [Candidatus Binatia bacterium]